jgi:hypothetical protein
MYQLARPAGTSSLSSADAPVYEGLARGKIWLGDETDSVRKARSLIETFTISVSEYLDGLADLYAPAVNRWVTKRGGTTFGSYNQEILQNFFEAPWFLHAWVFQEAVCAKSAIVRCGGLQIDFEAL